MNKEIISNLDSDNMFSIIKDLHKHIDHSFDIIKSNRLCADRSYKNIVISGMGGSAIGADFVKTILSVNISIPMYVNRSYDLPNWVGEDSLVVICSYSGNTEETISCYKKAVSLNVKPIVISSGGYLLNKAIESNYMYIKMPSGIQPRAAFGYSASLLLLLFCELKIADADIRLDLKKSKTSIEKLSLLYSEVKDTNKALSFASKIYNKFPLIYGTPITDVVSLRFRCQLAENTKILSSHFQIPEHNHNEIEGFGKINVHNMIIVWIKDIDDRKENSDRIKVTSDLLLENIPHQYFFDQSGSSLTERLFKLIYFFDWVSFYGAMFNNINPTPVNTILKLKSIMSK